MSPEEWWLEFDSRLAAQKRVSKGAGGFTAAEWDEARRKHREKVKHDGTCSP
jgi:hypothetical protein